MIVNSLFYGALSCTYAMLDRVVSFYSGFVYKVFYIGIFLVVGMCFWLYKCIGWGVCDTFDGFDFFIMVFYYLGHVACATVADLKVVSVKDFSWRASIGEILGN